MNLEFSGFQFVFYGLLCKVLSVIAWVDYFVLQSCWRIFLALCILTLSKQKWSKWYWKSQKSKKQRKKRPKVCNLTKTSKSYITCCKLIYDGFSKKYHATFKKFLLLLFYKVKGIRDSLATSDIICWE